jgi:predicted regulator of Ras-like GTPase activity (Roadblock/LC7/MglB family)
MNQTEDNVSSFELRSGITIFPTQDKAIYEVISNLALKLPAKFILVTAVTGQVISVAGDRGQIDLVALGSLVAGDLAASQEIARMSGEYQNFQIILREGEKTHTFISEAGPHLILFLQISDDVPLGWARLLVQEAARNIEKILDALQEDVESVDLGLEQEKLPDIFSGALDELWLDSG